MINNVKNHRLSSGFGYMYAWLSMGIIVAVCLMILINIYYLGIDAISIDFLTKEPSASATELSQSGILTPLIGTILLTLMGIIIALPLSLSTAIYLTFYAKKGLLKNAIKMAIDILAGMPTVVIALFALSIFTNPWLGFMSSTIMASDGSSKAYGRSFFVAGITMAIMILPFVIKAMEESLKAVPKSYYEASLALGAPKWHTIQKVVLQSAKQGVVTGVILGMGRIIGDTAIVWLTLGGTLRMTGVQPWWEIKNWISTVTNTGSTLTSYIYYTSPVGEGNNYEVAFGASLVLITIIIILNIITVLLGKIGQVR